MRTQWSLCFVCLWGSLLPCQRALAFQLSLESFSRLTTTTSLRVASYEYDYPQVATVNIEETTPRDIASMEEWATACGAQKAQGVQLVSTSTHEDAQDVGMMTHQVIPAGTPVLFVPSSMILSSSGAQQELANENLESVYQLFERLDATKNLPHFFLFLKLLREYELGDQSPWFPWLNSLPRYFSNGASMTHFCCSEALPPLVGRLANDERVRFIQFFRALKYAYFLSENTKNNRRLARWIFSVVYTRSFVTPDGNVRIAPMADMFNHGTETEIDIRYDEEGNCYAYTTYDVPAGYPLRMSYGDPTNPSFLFARYGFLDETSPATFCKIMITNPSQQLIDMGYDHSRMLFYKDTGGVSQEVWDVLLYQMLGSKPDEQQALYQAHMSGDQATKQAIHDKYSMHTSAALQNHIDTFLNQLDRLSGKAVGRDPSVHPRLPLILRHNDFVRNTFLTVRAGL